jgi:L-ascorbate metabolism protein UlaG (beta-lactamase superfamily)
MGNWSRVATDHYDPQRRQFRNPWRNTDKRLRELVTWWATAKREPWPRAVANQSYPEPPPVPAAGVAITMIGHASVLVRMPGVTILTDPHFSTHAGPFGRLGSRRVRPPGLTPSRLPPLDAVFISHSHYDHLDAASVRWLARHRRPLFVTCLGLGTWLRRRGAARVIELDWWERLELPGATLTVTPAQHWSNRAMFDLRRSLWGGCHLRHAAGMTAYFAGDSGYAPCFRDIRDRLGPPDVALLPIGAYEPRWFMQDHHMNPADAVRAHRDLEARQSIAIHHATFRLTDEGFDDPARDLAAALAQAGVARDAFRVLDVGESVVLA